MGKISGRIPNDYSRGSQRPYTVSQVRTSRTLKKKSTQMKTILSKTILLTFVILLFCKMDAQCIPDSSLYSHITYIDGKCEREIECIFQGIGRNPLDGDTLGIASAIKKEIKEIPKSSVSFVYKGQNYYISIKNECDTRRISYGERIRMRILFFEGIKQPYSFIHPFAIITKVELCHPRKTCVQEHITYLYDPGRGGQA